MKKNVVVIGGGNSSEYVISLQSAERIANSIDKQKYNVYTVIIKGNDWELISNELCGLIINKNDFSFSYNNQKTKFDCAFIAIHGSPGEDGKLQAYFELIGLPYTGSNVLASSLTFNKYYCNQFLEKYNILKAKSILIRKGDKIKSKNIVEKLKLPYFIKPNEGGSSFGITKVTKKEQIDIAINKAFEESNEVIIEEYIKGIEITCAVMKSSNGFDVFSPTEIVSKNEFFDYEAKYDEKKVDEITPARIDQKLLEKCKKLSLKIFQILNCSGIARIDYILTKEDFYFLEINTIPGMTMNSIVPKQFRERGVSEKEIYTLIIEDALTKI